jgi:hypothetical protein
MNIEDILKDIPINIGTKLYALRTDGSIHEHTVSGIYIEVQPTYTDIKFDIDNRVNTQFRLSNIGECIFLDKKDVLKKVVSNL